MRVLKKNHKLQYTYYVPHAKRAYRPEGKGGGGGGGGVCVRRDAEATDCVSLVTFYVTLS